MPKSFFACGSRSARMLDLCDRRKRPSYVLAVRQHCETLDVVAHIEGGCAERFAPFQLVVASDN